MKVATQLSQIRVLFQKNILTLKKGLLPVLMYCVVLPFAMGLFTGCNFMGSQEEFLHPPSTPVPGMLRCSTDTRMPGVCMNIGFTPINAKSKEFIQRMIKANVEEMEGEKLEICDTPVTSLADITPQYHVYGFNSKKEFMEFQAQNPLKVCVYLFLDLKDISKLPKEIDVDYYYMEYEKTEITGMTLFSLAVNSYTPNAKSFRISTRRMPDIYSSVSSELFKAFLISLIFQTIFILIAVVNISNSLFGRIMYDRKNDLLNYMRMFGMSISAYHTALFLSEMFIVQTIAGCFLGLGLYFGGGVLITLIDPAVCIVLWYLVSGALIGFNLLMSAIVPSLTIGNTLIPLMSIPGMFGVFLELMAIFIDVNHSEDNSSGGIVKKIITPLRIISFLTPVRYLTKVLIVIFFKLFDDLIINLLTQKFFLVPLSWSKLIEYMPEEGYSSIILNCIRAQKILLSNLHRENRQPVVDVNFSIDLNVSKEILNLLLIAIISPMVAAYLRDVLPWNEGRRKPFYFFLMPSFWFGSKIPPKTKELKPAAKGTTQVIDDDVIQEQLVADNPPPEAFAVSHLAKTYYFMGLSANNPIVKMFSPSGHAALKDFSLIMYQGQCVALLGHNGAGKSTMLGIVTGKMDCDAGMIFFKGRSVDPAYIHRNLGVCPQFDMLFEGMTVYEHLDLYIGLRGESLYDHWDTIKGRIDAFRMTNALNRRSEALSGGMKRRLSVLIATLGDPEIVLMDEPTTGMDPVNRRFVWKFLEEYKKGRQLLLTSHSMEEAEHLGDKIAIIRGGSLVAVGTTSYLKHKYDIGYRLTFNTALGFEEMAFHTIRAHIPNVQIDSVHTGCVRLCAPAQQLREMVDFLDQVETFTAQNYAGETISIFQDWTFTQMTLEDVFYRLNASVYEKKEVDKFAHLRNPTVAPSPAPVVNATFPQQSMSPNAPYGVPTSFLLQPSSPGSTSDPQPPSSPRS